MSKHQMLKLCLQNIKTTFNIHCIMFENQILEGMLTQLLWTTIVFGTLRVKLYIEVVNTLSSFCRCAGWF